MLLGGGGSVHAMFPKLPFKKGAKGIYNPLPYFSEDLDNSRQIINWSAILPEGCRYPRVIGLGGGGEWNTLRRYCQRVLVSIERHLQESFMIDMQKATFFTISWRNFRFTVKLSIQETNGNFKNHQKQRLHTPPYHTSSANFNLARQSLLYKIKKVK